jgi:hypothetical protein
MTERMEELMACIADPSLLRVWPDNGRIYDVVIAIVPEPTMLRSRKTKGVLVSGPDCILATMEDNGNDLEDGGFRPLPKECGVYRAKVRYWLMEAVLDFDADYGFQVVNVERVEL